MTVWLQLRGDCKALKKSILGDYNLGTQASNLITAQLEEPLLEVLKRMRMNDWTCVPLVTRSCQFITMFSVLHLQRLFHASLLHRDLTIRWDTDMYNILQSLIRCGFMPPLEDESRLLLSRTDKAVWKDRTECRSPCVCVSDSVTGRDEQVTPNVSKFKAMDAEENRDTSNASTGPVSHSSAICGYSPSPSNPGAMAIPEKKVICEEGVGNRHAVRSIMRKFVLSSRIVDHDLTLQDAVAHLLSTESSRLVFVDANE